MAIDIQDIDAKLEALSKNKEEVTDRIKQAQDVLRQGQADLNALQGAIQVCEQLKAADTPATDGDENE